MSLENQTPKLSILLSAFNAERFIAEAIESILSQTYKDFELIIADDGSSDQTRAIIDSFKDSRIKTYHNRANQGKTATINQLYNFSVGQYITVHDADDKSHSKRFEIQIEEFLNNPDLVMCGTWFSYINKKGHFLHDYQSISNYQDIKTQILKKSVFHGPTVVTKRIIIDQLGEFIRPFFNDYNEDADLNLRISELGECYNVPISLYEYRIVPNSLSKSLTAEKMVMYDLIVHFAKQRRATGSDDLQRNKLKKIDEFLTQQKQPFENDPSLIFHKAAGYFLYFDLKRQSLHAAYNAIIVAPLRASSYRLFFYCLRKILTNAKLFKKN